MAPLRLVPLDDVVVFPGMPVTLPADVGGDARVFLIPRRGDGYAKVGVVAEVTERVARAAATVVVAHRRCTAACPARRHTDQDGVLRVEVDERPDVAPAAGA